MSPHDRQEVVRVFDGIPLADLTPLGIILAVALLPFVQIARGKLIPRSTVDALEANYVRQIEDISHDRTEWRAAHRISEAARQTHAKQVEELLEHARTTDAFIRSLPNPGRAES